MKSAKVSRVTKTEGLLLKVVYPQGDTVSVLFGEGRFTLRIIPAEGVTNPVSVLRIGDFISLIYQEDPEMRKDRLERVFASALSISGLATKSGY